MRSIVFSIHQDVGFFICIVIYLCQLFICFQLTHNLFDSFDFVVSWIKVTARTRKYKKHIDGPTIPIPKSTRFNHINRLKQSSQATWRHLPLLHPFFLEIISSTMNRRPQSFQLTWVRWLLAKMLWMTLMDYGVNLYARIEASQKHLMKPSCLYLKRLQKYQLM